MRQAVMMAPKTLAFREVPVPEPGADRVLIKIEAVGLCTWEQKFYQGLPGSYPFVGGHEICGKVVKVGENVAQTLVPGDRVAVASLTRCGECYYCRRNLDNLCENVGSESLVGPYWGPAGFSEYILARGYEVFKLGEAVDPTVGTLAEPLACVIRSMDRGDFAVGDTVLVLGAGVMGALHIMMARFLGARVIVSEVDEGRRRRALEFGAELAVDPLKEDLPQVVRSHGGKKGAEAVFFTAGGAPAIQEGLASLAKNGRLVIYGGTKADDILKLDPKIFHYDEIYVTGVTKHTKDTFRRSVELISGKALPLEPLISRRFPFDQIAAAFEDAGRLDSYRTAVVM